MGTSDHHLSSSARDYRRGVLALLTLVACVCPAASADDGPKAFAVPKEVQAALTAFCVDCHGETGKGNVRLEDLEKLKPNVRLDLLNKVQDQLFYKMMPPASAEQPIEKEARVLSEWVRTELRRHKASKLDDRLPYPDAGNYVDHVALFDGSNRDKPFTPARRWLVSPQIFEERLLDVFKLEGREREQFKRTGFHGVTNPFVLPDHAGVRYYDLTVLDGGHLLVMLTNAEWIATKQIQAVRIKAGDAKGGATDDPKDRWYPKTTPAAFEAIIAKKGAPTDDDIRAAVQSQFDCVLRRSATESEAKAYVQFTRDAVQLGGNTEGLRQMLKAVLLESEFVYRLEFGTGKADEFGRKALVPREAADAIAYALGDRGPDAPLLKAARDGRLNSKADYEREVLRLLDDKSYYAGVVDRSLGLYPSTVATHPRLVRFFREFFGYPTAVKVFKDVKRASGHYVNADRGSTQTPGHLIDEADTLVDWALTRDKAVFETLLTTDRYFVYHNVSNEKGAQQIAAWKTAYELLKNTDWKKNPDAVAADHQETIKKYLDPKGLPGGSPGSRAHDNSLTRYMTHFDHTFGKGHNPFTILPWAHGNQYWHAPIYNLPKMPGRGGQYGDGDDLDYQPVQPFALPNRKGLLTHPAWLVAFSANTHSDPIRRGRWIREKLLAGVVPDVPITVDAKIPDDPPHTLRERVHSATQGATCAKCHSRMNQLGYPLEAFDDFGRYRTAESLEHPDNLLRQRKGNDADVYKTKPIDPTGKLDGTGDPKLDGTVTDAFDLIDRLARSERVRQSIIRHAFRFFMGRNELPSDSQTLIDADRVYVKSGGSFKAVVVSLLTSDSFIYRKQAGN